MSLNCSIFTLSSLTKIFPKTKFLQDSTKEIVFKLHFVIEDVRVSVFLTTSNFYLKNILFRQGREKVRQKQTNLVTNSHN